MALNQTDRLVKKLAMAKSCLARYEDLVENKNTLIGYAQTIESEALDVIQAVETSRIRFFFDSVLRQLSSLSTDGLNSLPSRTSEIDETVARDLKRGKDLLANIFAQQSFLYEEGLAQNDVEALGLPGACAKLRNDVKKELSEISTNIKTVQIVNEFLESLRTACVTLKEGLKINSAPSNMESLGSMALLDAMGCLAAKIWRAVVRAFENEGIFVSEFASTVVAPQAQKLETALESAQRDLKSESDFDDRNWKLMCDTARVETKAASRYRHVKAQQTKAREWLTPTDTEKTMKHQVRCLVFI